MMKNFKTKKFNKKGDMSIALIVAIVLGLTIILISIYMIYNKAKIASGAGGCDPSDCATKADKCVGDTKYSFTPCTMPDGETKGKCCFAIGG